MRNLFHVQRLGSEAHYWIGGLCFSIYRGLPGVFVRWFYNWYQEA